MGGSALGKGGFYFEQHHGASPHHRRNGEYYAMDMEQVGIVKVVAGKALAMEDDVAAEEPLEIFVDGEPYYLTMRLPGEGILLALGLCSTEGIIDGMDNVAATSHCKDISTNRINIFLNSDCKTGAALSFKRKRSPTYSSCGICGKELVEEICTSVKKIEKRVTVPVSRILEMHKALKEGQIVFHRTGGTHGAAIFTADGALLALSEDIGRHNALDKAIGKVISTGKIGSCFSGFAYLTPQLRNGPEGGPPGGRNRGRRLGAHFSCRGTG
jgi:FdhD protein